jgi:adenosine deaminase
VSIGQHYRRSDLLRGEEIPGSLLRELPKTDLHCHLDGSLRLATYRELSGEVVETEQAAPGTGPSERGGEGGQEESLPTPEMVLTVLQEAQSLSRTAYELACDAASEGCWYLEVRVCPLLHIAEGLTVDEVVGAVCSGLQRAEQEIGIRTGIIITGLRTISPTASLELARLAVNWQGRGVVGFDLYGTEEHYPAKDHREAFYHVMNHNLPSTIHAGEGFGPASIHQALHYCGANRIGHGTRLHEDEDLLAYVNDHRIPLEVCLSSNVRSGVVQEVGHHPLRQYMELGLRVTLNTDNTMFARTSIAGELRLAAHTFDLTLLQTENLLINGFKSAFLHQREKERLIARALARFAELRDAHRLDALPYM